MQIELAARGTYAPTLPTQVYLEVTNRCNSLCVSCPLTYDHILRFEPKHHLSWAQFRQVVDQIPQIERAVGIAVEHAAHPALKAQQIGPFQPSIVRVEAKAEKRNTGRRRVDLSLAVVQN